MPEIASSPQCKRRRQFMTAPLPFVPYDDNRGNLPESKFS